MARIKRCGYRGGFEVRNVEFNLGEGELLLVTGKSGSGKTTLIRALTGTIELAGGYLDGEIYIYGRNTKYMSPEEMYSTITYIPQEPWYSIIGYTVYAEICHIMALNGKKCRGIDLSIMGLEKLINRLTYTLSAGEIQKVAWSSTLLKESKLLVLDEPLVYLDRESRTSIYSLIDETIRKNIGVVLVDHNPFFWEPLKPKILYLENGYPVYYGEWSRSVFQSWSEHVNRVKRSGGDVFVEFKNVWFRYPGGGYIIKEFTESINKGSITCITGPNGSGKSTILKLGAGVLKPKKGSIRRNGSTIYIPENPLLYFTMPTPREELMLNARKEDIANVVEYFDLKNILDTPIAMLSSGERRRLAIASAYLSGYQGYFIDEPTGGLDYWNARKVLELLDKLVDEDKAIIVASHDPRVIEFADRLVNLDSS